MNNFIAHSTHTYPNSNNTEPFLPQAYATSYIPPANNRFVYVRQGLNENLSMPASVHVNPHFNKNVFVNPNFQTYNNVLPPLNKIHINPNVKAVNLQKQNSKQIHVNPNVLHTNPISLQRLNQELNIQLADKKQEDVKRTVFSSRTKLIRTPIKNRITPESKKIRRTSVRTKFKIVTSSISNNSLTETKKFKSSKYKYKLVQCKKVCTNKSKDKFKVDNRIKQNYEKPLLKSKKVFFTYGDKTLNGLNNSLSLVKIGGILYRKSKSTLHKANTTKRTKPCVLNKRISKSKYKIITIASKSKTSDTPVTSNDPKAIRKIKLRVTKKKRIVSSGKLRKCNIPCPYFKKFGRCRQQENGKCFRKHDPDQIALCTKFLQGACVNDKCLLSHNVSPEKMPTCKFYLEGNCSKDKCTYLHVKISPKADVCKDFLEGFCKKGAQCDKRHQYLCPDYEKLGECPKQRCPYPHGKMVRKYSVFDKNKFAKKCSEDNSKTAPKVRKDKCENKIDVIKTDNADAAVATRYYNDKNSEDFAKLQNLGDNVGEPTVLVGARPKLGQLPSFIAFEES